MKHQPQLDSFRAVAVILVILVHYGYVEAGWIGVQLFFVLSGYLITTILLEEKQNTLGFYLKRFYWRRTLRIFPLYFGYLIIFTIFNQFARPALFEPERDFFRTYWPWLYSYTLNFGRIYHEQEGTYFFQHFWSLCVEEQFYLVWPIVVFFMPVKYFLRAIYLILIIAPISRFIVFSYLYQKTGNASIAGIGAYYIPLCQFDSFAMGALLATGSVQILFQHKYLSKIILIAITLISLINMGALSRSSSVDITSIGFPSLMLSNFQYVWGYSLINLAGMIFIYELITNPSHYKLANNKILIWIGKISYGVYVFHYPILDLWGRMFRYKPFSVPGFISFWFYLFVTLLIAQLSYQLYEKQFLNLKNVLYQSRS